MLDITIPCEAKDVMSFKTPEKLFIDSKCVFRIYSKGFMINLLLKYNLDPTFVYSCKMLRPVNIRRLILKKQCFHFAHLLSARHYLAGFL